MYEQIRPEKDRMERRMGENIQCLVIELSFLSKFWRTEPYSDSVYMSHSGYAFVASSVVGI